MITSASSELQLPESGGRGRKKKQLKLGEAEDLQRQIAIADKLNLTQVSRSEVVASKMLAKHADESPPIFPFNLYLEGCDQHSRWFLCSLVSSVALTKRAPF